jgi:dsDNA-specific endonuclease/ATPase MutS2
MNNTQAKIFAASLGGKIPELDLHGLYPEEALEKLELFLFANRNEQYCRVIYGMGTGKLREAVLGYLKKHPLVEDVVEDGGSCVVIF